MYVFAFCDLTARVEFQTRRCCLENPEFFSFFAGGCPSVVAS
jgi:hypothetical protein